jgi:type IV pilus assembly protein PilA
MNRSVRRKPAREETAAFTLVEIMIVVVLIGLLAAMAIPAFQRVREKAIVSRYANDFRQFATAFQNYNTQNGGWPAAQTTGGTVSADLAPYMPASWAQTSPMGGKYTWSGSTGRIRLIGSNATDSLMQKVDALLDDGNIVTGDFSRMTAAGSYHLQLR